MEFDKCQRCNGEVYGFVSDTPFCVKHYVENYKKDTRFLEHKLNQLMDYFSRGQDLTFKEKEFLKEVRIQFPKMTEEFNILFNDLD